MSDRYLAFKQRIEGRSDVRSGRGVGRDAIAAADRALGPLPSEYREFLADFGWLVLGHFLVLGLGDDAASYQDVVEVNRWEHDPEEAGNPLPPNLVAVHPIGNGDYDCIDCSEVKESGNAPVVGWSHELPEDQEPWEEAPSFAAYLHDLLDRIEEGERSVGE